MQVNEYTTIKGKKKPYNINVSAKIFEQYSGVCDKFPNIIGLHICYICYIYEHKKAKYKNLYLPTLYNPKYFLFVSGHKSGISTPKQIFKIMLDFLVKEL